MSELRKGTTRIGRIPYGDTGVVVHQYVCKETGMEPKGYYPPEWAAQAIHRDIEGVAEARTDFEEGLSIVALLAKGAYDAPWSSRVIDAVRTVRHALVGLDDAVREVSGDE
jgi:hypothetical protein